MFCLTDISPAPSYRMLFPLPKIPPRLLFHLFMFHVFLYDPAFRSFTLLRYNHFSDQSLTDGCEKKHIQCVIH